MIGCSGIGLPGMNNSYRELDLEAFWRSFDVQPETPGPRESDAQVGLPSGVEDTSRIHTVQTVLWVLLRPGAALEVPGRLRNWQDCQFSDGMTAPVLCKAHPCRHSPLLHHDLLLLASRDEREAEATNRGKPTDRSDWSSKSNPWMCQ
jgi:hypothetical protein